MVEGLDLPRLEGDEFRPAARILDGLPRLGELDLLDHVGREEGDFPSVAISHLGPLSESDRPGLTLDRRSEIPRASVRHDHVRMELNLFLRAWHAAHPEAQADLVERP